MTFISILIFSIFFIFLGWRIQTDKQVKSEENLGKGAGLIETTSSLFSVIGAGEYGFAISLIITYGLFGTSFLFALGFAFIAATIITSKLREHAHKSSNLRFDGYTNYSTPDFFADYSGKYGSILITLINIFAFIAILLIQFVVGGTVISLIASIPYTSAVLIMAITVLLYCSLGGLRALFHTDVWQGLIMWLALFSTVIYLYFFSPDISLIQTSKEQLLSKNIGNISNKVEPILLFILTIAAAFSGPDVWQRISASNNDSIAKKALWGSGISLMIFALLLIALSAHLAIEDSITSSDDAFMEYLKSMYGFSDNSSQVFIQWPPYITALFSIGLLSAFVSTADTSLILLTTITQNELSRFDLWNISENSDERVSPDSFTKHSCWLFIVYTIVGVLFALITPSIVELFAIAIGLLSLVGFPALFIILGWGSSQSILLVLILEILLFIVISFFPSILPSSVQDFAWLALVPLLPVFLLLFSKSRKCNT